MIIKINNNNVIVIIINNSVATLNQIVAIQTPYFIASARGAQDTSAPEADQSIFSLLLVFLSPPSWNLQYHRGGSVPQW